MCYNNCEIEIKSTAGGEVSVINTCGKVKSEGENYRFEYELDGDKCTLTVKDGRVRQIRRGKQNIDMLFHGGDNTECSISADGFSGSFQVYTHFISFMEIDTGEAYSVEIYYTLGKDDIRLKFTAKIALKDKRNED